MPSLLLTFRSTPLTPANGLVKFLQIVRRAVYTLHFYSHYCHFLIIIIIIIILFHDL